MGEGLRGEKGKGNCAGHSPEGEPVVGPFS